MKTIFLNKGAAAETLGVATIGFFDGVHRGHRYLIDRLTADARERGLSAGVITFDRHPRQVLHTDYQPQLLTPFEEKQRLLSETGIDYCVVLPFSQEMAAFSARMFMGRVLAEQLQVKRLYIGYDHRFGHNRAEGFADYVRYGMELGIDVIQSDEFLTKGKIQDVAAGSVSSSRIRFSLLKGDVEMACRLLGYAYSLCGKVVEGVQEGRKLGFPTANIALPYKEKLIPLSGVYAVSVHIEGETSLYPGMMNIGTRPTFGENKQTLEVHVLDYSGYLYGKTLSVEFLHRLRDEHRFVNVEELRRQLETDAREVREYLQKDHLS